jgi:hypothetical protein
MKDSELRGVVLDRFYDARHKVIWLSFSALTTHLTTDQLVLGNICDQLSEHGLIEWRALTSSGQRVEGMGRITARGIDVVEGTAKAPITVVLHHDQSIAVSGSTNVQIGSGHSLRSGLEIGKIVLAIDQSKGSDAEKKEAKGLLEKIASNPLLVGAFNTVFGWSLPK